jgi:hypothetical protein
VNENPGRQIILTLPKPNERRREKKSTRSGSITSTLAARVVSRFWKPLDRSQRPENFHKNFAVTLVCAMIPLWTGNLTSPQTCDPGNPVRRSRCLITRAQVRKEGVNDPESRSSAVVLPCFALSRCTDQTN